MREIKFRVWSMISEPRMLDWDVLENGLADELLEVENWKVMQYTGLKDKNGVEIYEGDIISDQYDKGAVEFDNARFYWPHGEEWGMIFDDEVEVIGNIYQNPELLEK